MVPKPVAVALVLTVALAVIELAMGLIDILGVPFPFSRDSFA